MDMNFFKHDAFSATTMMKAIENYEFQPGLISSLNLFEEVETSTTVVGIERRDNTLSLIQTSERGAPWLKVIEMGGISAFQNNTYCQK